MRRDFTPTRRVGSHSFSFSGLDDFVATEVFFEAGDIFYKVASEIRDRRTSHFAVLAAPMFDKGRGFDVIHDLKERRSLVYVGSP